MEQRPDEDQAIEELDDRVTDPGRADVPEADALEQGKALDPAGETQPDAVGDKPEADALEQERGLGDEGGDADAERS